MDKHERRRITHLILERARHDVVFKEKIIELSVIADKNVWDNNDKNLYYEFLPLACQIASDVGLFIDLEQSYLSSLIEWFMDSGTPLRF